MDLTDILHMRQMLDIAADIAQCIDQFADRYLVKHMSPGQICMSSQESIV